MAQEILITSRQGMIVGTDPESIQALREIGEGEIVKATLVRPRNVQHHRKFFALLREFFKVQTLYPTESCLLDALKIAVGAFDTYRLLGREICKPHSIAFHAMDQKDFEQFYERALEIFIGMLPGLNRADLEARVADILDGYQPKIGKRVFSHRKLEAA